MNVLQLLTGDAARAAGVRVAWISVVSSAGEEILAAVGSSSKQMGVDTSFALRLGEPSDVVVVPDTIADGRFASHPLVAGPPHIRFYAAAPIVDGSGQFAGVLSVIDRQPQNLTNGQIDMLRALARHASREVILRDEIMEASERFREFFEQTTDLVISLGPHGSVLHANETARTALGISLGKSLTACVEPERRDELREQLDRVFESGNAERVETVFVSPSGGRITLEGWLRPKIVEGKTLMARVIFRDVTDRKQFEAELGNARDAALEAARVKTQFLSNISHEIRTPMNGLIGMIDLLLSTPLNAEQQDFAHQARASAEQLLSTVNNILYISNIEAGSLTSSQVDFDLYRTLQRIVEVMKVAALGKDLEIRFLYDESLPPVFRGNASKLRQIVSNLMENAVKFTESGRIDLRVKLQTETDTHRVVRFDVRDTGIGIAPEDRMLLFERFSQIESGSTRRFGGAGLGLATARHLVETMGGLMDVDSAPGKGSTFFFTVPFAKGAHEQRPVPSSDMELKGKRVLLVDPHPSSRKVIRHYLETTWEMRFDSADSGGEALDMLRRASASDPYRVLVFGSMNDLGSLDLARAVRDDPAIARTSLVHLLMSGDVPNEEAMRQAGINSYTSKPVGQRELFDALAIALAHDAISSARLLGADQDTRPEPPPLTPEQRKNVRLLLVEDNFLNMKLTMSQLQKLGFEGDSVANGREALEALEKHDYPVILMDCQMPVLDGYDATAEIRRRENRGNDRHYIIAMTANALEGDREKCLAAGMDDYLAKPTRAEDLDRALARFYADR